MTAPDSSAASHEFLNCEMEFECPKDWFELSETNSAGIKHCSACNKNVYLCVTQEELDGFALKGECIAFFSNPDLPTRLQLSREKAEVNRRDPNFRLERVTLGLPRSDRRGKLKSFLDTLDKKDNGNSEGE